jgi:2,4-dienoyl-CoA reductase-like NADH-dependent reductase (Old Yellow Enzyme family)
MPELFSEFHSKDVTLRNRIAISPMMMFFCGNDGVMTDWHLMHLGARAAGGAGLVVVEQLAVSPEGRMTPNCAGIWSDDQMPALRRFTEVIKSAGAVPGVQLGQSGRKAASPRHGTATRSCLRIIPKDGSRSARHRSRSAARVVDAARRMRPPRTSSA